MWQKHLKRTSEIDSASQGSAATAAPANPPSTPKKLLGSLLEGATGKASLENAARLEEEAMTARLAEVQAQSELKEQRLKVMELETNVS